MARRLDKRDSAELMFDDWFDEIRRRRGLAADRGPPWDALAATPALGRRLLAALKDNHDRVERGENVDLVELHNLLRQARKAIG